jgi:hypothetical protein
VNREEQREMDDKQQKLLRQIERAKKAGSLTKPTKAGKLKK